MKNIKLVFLPIGDFDTAGNKRLKNLEKYLNKIEGVQTYSLQLKGYSSKKTKSNPAFYLELVFNLIANVFYFPAALARQKQKDALNFLYFYEGYKIRIYRILVAKLLGYRILVDLVENPDSVGYTKSFTQKLKLLYALFFYRISSFFASGLVVVSKFLKDKVHTDLGNKIPVYHLPVSFDPDDFKTGAAAYDHTAVFYGGSYGNNYDFESLFKAFNNVVNDGKNAKLYLSGKTDEQVKALVKSKIEKADRVVFLGFLEESNYYATICNMNILCMPRNNTIQANAGFPFKLAEYLATGKSVICSRVSDIKDYITEEDAFIYEPGDYQKIESILREIIADPLAAKVRGDNGKQKAEQYFGAAESSLGFYKYLIQL